MFISKKSIIAVFLVIIFMLIITIVSPIIVKQANTDLGALGVVVLDAGHGGIDGGVVGSAGVKESDINLAISLILQKKLVKQGVKVVMTRTTEQSFSNVKREDMAMRKKVIQESNPDLVISIHTNKFSDPKRCGTQIFYDDTKIGENFARVMQSHINDSINKKYRTRGNYEALPANLYITKCIKKPSIVIECGFISNANDERLLLDATFRNDLADSITSVVVSALIEIKTHKTINNVV